MLCYKMNKNQWCKFLYAVVALFVFTSCNKEIAEKITFVSPDDVADEYSTKSYRVAYIVIDGAVGTVVGGEATDYNKMPFLASMTNKGLFSWNSIAANETEDITFYADMLTGVDKNKHNVTSSDLSAAALETYPLVFDRLKTELNIRTAVLTSNPAVEILTAASTIDNKQVLSSDADVVLEAKKELSRADAHFALITLRNVDKVGQESGYGPKSEAYLDALHTVDGQIREIVNTIEARSNYGSEKWLIVVASNRGGDYEIDPILQDNSLYSVPVRNNFVLFYNNQFQYKIIQKVDLSDPTYDGSAIRYTSSNTSAVMDATDADIYNIGNTADKEFTIQLKIKVHALGTNNPAFLSKQGNTGNPDIGWSFIHSSGAGWRLKVQGTQITDSEVFRLNEWYTLTAKIYNDNGTRKAKLFRNGVFKIEGTLSTAQGTSPSTLKLGYGASWTGDNAQSHSITDVRIYDTALPDAYIESNYCQTAVYDDDTYWDNLIGYWPAIEGSGNQIADKSKSRRHFNVTGAAVWNAFSERSGSLCPTAPQDLAKSTIRSVDAPILIYNWLGILGADKYNLDSKVWAPSYSNN